MKYNILRKIALTAVVSALALSSCVDMDLKSKSELSSESVWSDPEAVS